MEDEKIYSSIANALEGFGKLRTAKVSIYSIEDKYARIPSLRFRFKELDKTDPVYTRIKAVVDSFKGNLRWTVVTHDETENYLITVLLDNIPHFLLSRAETEIYITNLGEDKYKEMIDKALDDIPNLASTLHRAASES